MRRLTATPGAALAAFLLFTSEGVPAQEEAPTWSPVEIFGCNFVDDAGMDDLDRVIDAWNDWMDERGVDTYSAFVLTPHFTAASFPYEVGWLGAWTDGEALGGQQLWLAEGGPILDDFAQVIVCPLHQALAITTIKDIGEVAEGDIVPVEFTDCTLNEGRRGPEAHAAVTRWVEQMAERGSEAGHWLLRPGPGEEPDATYSFKWASAYPSWAHLGQEFEWYFNDGADQSLGDMTGNIFSCNHPRIYDSRNVRMAAEQQ